MPSILAYPYTIYSFALAGIFVLYAIVCLQPAYKYFQSRRGIQSPVWIWRLKYHHSMKVAVAIHHSRVWLQKHRSETVFSKSRKCFYHSAVFWASGPLMSIPSPYTYNPCFYQTIACDLWLSSLHAFIINTQFWFVEFYIYCEGHMSMTFFHVQNLCQPHPASKAKGKPIKMEARMFLLRGLLTRFGAKP